MAYRNQTFVVLLLAALWLTGCDTGPTHCSVCDRHECKAMAFRVTMPEGRKVETCCARCGLHFLATNSAARGAEATDFAHGKWFDAAKAVYVEGSDVNLCAKMEVRRDAQGCCMIKGFDRCMPSLIAFAARADAESFQKQHGGTLHTWEQISRASTP